MKIFKYRLPECPGSFVILVPGGGEFLCAQNQYGRPVMWLRVNENSEPREQEFYMLETGADFPQGYSYLSTIQLQNGNYVLHLLEQQPRG